MAQRPTDVAPIGHQTPLIVVRLAEAHHSDVQAAARLVGEVNALIAAVHINTRIPGLQPERFEDMITAALREVYSTSFVVKVRL